MNTLYSLGARSFSSGNPRVFLSVSKAGQAVGNLVFELYADRQPQTAQNFLNLCTAKEGSRSLAGTSFHHGLQGFGISGGKIGDEDVSSFDVRLPDERLDIRHNRRGLLTTSTQGTNAVGSQFTITFDETPYLDGYQAVFGELVEGESVLKALEQGVDRLGNVKEDFQISAAGLKH